MLKMLAGILLILLTTTHAVEDDFVMVQTENDVEDAVPLEGQADPVESALAMFQTGGELVELTPQQTQLALAQLSGLGPAARQILAQVGNQILQAQAEDLEAQAAAQLEAQAQAHQRDTAAGRIQSGWRWHLTLPERRRQQATTKRFWENVARLMNIKNGIQRNEHQTEAELQNSADELHQLQENIRDQRMFHQHYDATARGFRERLAEKRVQANVAAACTFGISCIWTQPEMNALTDWTNAAITRANNSGQALRVREREQQELEDDRADTQRLLAGLTADRELVARDLQYLQDGLVN